MRDPKIDVPAARQLIPVGDDVAVHAEARDAAVGIDAKPHVRRGFRVVDRKQIVRVAGELRFLQRLGPLRARDRVRRRIVPEVRTIDCAGVRIVALEERGMNVDAPHDAARAQPDDAPVMDARSAGRGVAAAACLPAVHPLPFVGVFPFDPDRRSRFDQVLFRREEVVVARDDGSAETLGGEIEELPEGFAHSNCPVGGLTMRPSSQTRTPRTNVVFTLPRSRRPA